MALTLADAIVNIIGDDSKLDGVLGRARQKADGFVNRVGGGIKKGLTTAVMAVGAAGLAVTGTLVGLGVQAVGMGADAVETASLLETSLGGAADSLNSQLREFATNANRSFYELQEGSATFVAMTRAMGATEQEAADLSGGFVQMATDLGSFFNQPTEQALADLQGALAGSSETMQKYGIDVKETTLRQMALDQGLIDSASDTIPRLVRAQLIQQAIMEQAADAMGDAERTSGSWSNMLRGLQGRLRDTATDIGLKLIPVLEPLLQGFMSLVDQGLKVVLPIVEDVLYAFGRFGEELKNGVEPVQAIENLLARLAVALGGNSETAMQVRDAFSQVMGIAQELGGRIGEVLTPIFEAITGFVSWKDVLIGLAIGIGAVVLPIIGSLLVSIAGVVAPILLIIGIVALLRNAWENNWGGIQEKTRAVIEFVRNIIQSVMSGVQAFWAQNGDAILAKAKEIWEGIKTAIDTAIKAAQAIIQAVSDAIKASWDRHGGDIEASARRFWEAIKGFIESTINTIKGIIETVANGIKAFWEGHGEDLQTLAEGVWTAIETAIDTAFVQIKNAFDTFAALFSGDWEGFGEGLKEMWQTWWDAIVNVVSTIWESIQPLLSSMWTSLSGWFTEKAGAMASIGSNLITALADAIRTRANNYLKTVAQGVANLLPDWVKAILGISSPSKVFMAIGWDVGEGLALGLDDTTGDIERAMASMTRAMSVEGSMLAPALAPTMGAVVGGGSQTTDNRRTVIIEQLILQGVQDPEGFLARLDALTVPGVG